MYNYYCKLNFIQIINLLEHLNELKSKDIYKCNLSDSQVLFKYLRRFIGVLNKKTKCVKYVNEA